LHGLLVDDPASGRPHSLGESRREQLLPSSLRFGTERLGIATFRNQHRKANDEPLERGEKRTVERERGQGERDVVIERWIAEPPVRSGHLEPALTDLDARGPRPCERTRDQDAVSLRDGRHGDEQVEEAPQLSDHRPALALYSRETPGVVLVAPSIDPELRL